MINRDVFRSLIEQYKAQFSEIRKNGLYQWKAIPYFKEYWDIESRDFASMLNRAFSQMVTPLFSAHPYSRQVLLFLAERDPESVRIMFRQLFDENSPLLKRIESFIRQADVLHRKYKAGDNRPCQTIDAVCACLWLRYPDKYYLYQEMEYKYCAELLQAAPVPEAGSINSVSAAMNLYNEIREALRTEEELLRLNNGSLDETCYADPLLGVLTGDVVRFISMYAASRNTNHDKSFQRWMQSRRKPDGTPHFTSSTIYAYLNALRQIHRKIDISPFSSVLFINDLEDLAEMEERIRTHPDFEEINEKAGNGSLAAGLKQYRVFLEENRVETAVWWPARSEYDPGISEEEWLRLLNDPNVCNASSKEVLNCWLQMGGTATCTQVSAKYGREPGFYNMVATRLAARVQEAVQCPAPPPGKEGIRRWPILFIGKPADGETPGTYLWKLRDELRSALTKCPVRRETTMASLPVNTILYGPPGTGKTYHAIQYAVAIVDNRPLHEVEKQEYAVTLARYRQLKEAGLIAFCTFHQSYGYEEFIEGIRPAPFESGGEGICYSIQAGAFKKFCDDAREAAAGKSMDLGIGENPTIWKVSLQQTGENPIRTDCMEHDHIRIGWSDYGEELLEEAAYRSGGKKILNAFINVMQIGDIVMSCYSENEIDAIGVITDDYEWADIYPTYKRLRKVNWLVKGIREDIRAVNGGKKMTLSTIYRLNQISLSDVLDILQKYRPGQIRDKKNRVFIIDEINRGNISKIFGELITLIEPSRRLGAPEETTAKLAYSGKEFGVPGNVYLLGTMNTADRSIARVDTALRRRFCFREMQPNPAALRGVAVNGVAIDRLLDRINRRIEVLYDREHTIGHAYFMELRQAGGMDRLADIFRYSILPLLQEYFFEDYEKIRVILGDNEAKNKKSVFIAERNEEDAGLYNTDYSGLQNAYYINEEAFHNPEAYKKIYQ